MWRRVALVCFLSTAAPAISRAYVGALFLENDPRNVKDVKARVQESDVVFRGTVTKLDSVDAPPTRYGGRRVVATFEVAERWKGPAALLVRIFAYQDSEDLQLYLKVGKEYLVFANLGIVDAIDPGRRDSISPESPIILASDGCGRLSGNTESTDVQDTLKQLGSPLKETR